MLERSSDATGDADANVPDDRRLPQHNNYFQQRPVGGYTSSIKGISFRPKQF